jgi:hypothetical protein
VHASCRLNDGSEICRSFDSVDVALLESTSPWRQFRWRKGQKHYSGSYWSSTMGAHVIYESRLELARLIYADFDRSVSRIFAQPLLLDATVGNKKRRHIPDFLLVTDKIPIVVDVKPRARLSRPEVRATFAWARHVVESHGWRYEVWTEPPEAELANLRFLSGYRRAWLFRQDVLERLLRPDMEGLTIGQAITAQSELASTHVRSYLFHLLWQQMYSTDLARPLSAQHTLRRVS